MNKASPSGERPIGVIGAAVALACSWCWVIGMVFPVFMIQDFGWPGWVVFVVPNVIGAASVGFLLRYGRDAEAFAETHRHAIRMFSWVTIAFHGFVFFYIANGLAGSSLLPDLGPEPLNHAMYLVLPCLVVLWFAWRFSSRSSLSRIVRDAFVVFGASLACIAVGQGMTEGGVLSLPSSEGDFPRSFTFYALAGTSLGFLTCPFLDITFLRIRAELDTPARGRAAFALGFFVPFLLLVAMTALYAGAWVGDTFFSTYIVAHIAFQSAYTVGFHGWALNRPPAGTSSLGLSMVPAFVFGVVGAIVWLGVQGDFRLGYEFFISMYALPFPAYVWVVCVWAKRPTRRSLTVCAVAILLGAPLFAIGYLGDRWAFVPLGVAVVLVSPALLWLPIGGGQKRRRESAV